MGRSTVFRRTTRQPRRRRWFDGTPSPAPANTRYFDATDDKLTIAAGGLASLDGTGLTFLALVELANTSLGGSIIYANDEFLTVPQVFRLDVTGGNVVYSTQTTNHTILASAPTGEWLLLGVSVPSGGGVVRAHTYNFTAGGSPGHANVGTATASSTTVGASGNVHLGSAGFNFLDGNIAAVAMRGATTSDGEFDALIADLQSWADLSSMLMLLPFQQAAVTPPVEDFIGTSDETARTGTTVVADAPTPFDFTLTTAASVTPADAAHAHSAEQPALTQVHVLAPADALHAHTAEQPALTQVHVLASADAAHAHSAEQPAVAQVHALVPADAAHAHAAEQPALTQTHVLAATDAAHAHSAEQPVLTQVHVLAPADALHAHVAEQPTLTQAHVLSPADALHAHTAEQPSVSESGASSVAPADATHAHTADQPAITQVHVLAPADAFHAHAADQPALTQIHALAAADAAHVHSAEQPAFTQIHILTPADALHAHTAEQPSVVTPPAELSWSFRVDQLPERWRVEQAGEVWTIGQATERWRVEQAGGLWRIEQAPDAWQVSP